jgi:hypothetical protein
MNKIFLLAACMGLLIVSGCVKPPLAPHTICSNNAVISYYPGFPDGCERSIIIDSVRYLPQNLGSSFLQNGLTVSLCYTLTGDSTYCGNTSWKFKEINIESISR